MNKLSKLLLGAAVIGGASSAFAASESSLGHYVSFGGKMAAPKKKDGNKFKKGYGAQLELGMSYDNWRLGLEGSFAKNKFKDAVAEELLIGVPSDDGLLNPPAVDGGSVTSTGTYKSMLLDRISTTGLMANIYYDHYFTDDCFIFAGVGIGVARVKVAVIAERLTKVWAADMDYGNLGNAIVSQPLAQQLAHDSAVANVAQPDGQYVSGGPPAHSDRGVNARLYSREATLSCRESAGTTVFAWQIMAGLGFEITDNWTLMAGYKLFNAQKVKAPIVTGGTKKIKYPMTHTATVNLMYRF